MKQKTSAMTAKPVSPQDTLERFLGLCATPSDARLSDNLHSVFDKVVVEVSKAPLDHLDQDAATRFAVALWYFSDAMTESLEQRLQHPGLAPVRKRRLLYLVDRLRRFPVLTPEKAAVMKSFVNQWRCLATTADSLAVRTAEKVNRYDKVAVTWGLTEDVSGLMSKVLEYQTRHFVDAHALPSGYSELCSRKTA
ncbi:hypothetical protein [Pseudomonas vranovensis]|uniref:hypothetical protein n=1 Tax=Pseudomonas vranovensis TaxID=321661 RepID=UPI002181F25B|nr:hypothetical protein [Pseudomonas vranovensis]